MKRSTLPGLLAPILACISVVLALPACKAQTPKGMPGARCQSDGDCLHGVYCAMNTCDVGACSSQVSGERPRRIDYEYDEAGSEILRVDRVDDQVEQKAVTTHSKDHRSYEQRMLNADGRVDLIIRVQLDEKGRKIHFEMLSDEQTIIRRQVYRYEDPACVFASKSEIYDGSDEKLGNETSRCEKGLIMEATESDLEGKPTRTRRYRYDDQGRWVGLEIASTRAGETYNNDMVFVRDDKGFLTAIRTDSDGDGEFEETETFDYGCLRFDPKGARRRP